MKKLILWLFIIVQVAGSIPFYAQEKDKNLLIPLSPGNYWRYVVFLKKGEFAPDSWINSYYLRAPIENFNDFYSELRRTVYLESNKEILFSHVSKSPTFSVKSKIGKKNRIKIPLWKILSFAIYKKTINEYKTQPIFFYNFLNEGPYSTFGYEKNHSYRTSWGEELSEVHFFYRKDEWIWKLSPIPLLDSKIDELMKITDYDGLDNFLQRNTVLSVEPWLPIEIKNSKVWIKRWRYIIGGNEIKRGEINVFLINKGALLDEAEKMIKVKKVYYNPQYKEEFRIWRKEGKIIEGNVIKIQEMLIKPGIGPIRIINWERDKNGKLNVRDESYLLKFYTPAYDYIWEIDENGLKKLKKKLKEIINEIVGTIGNPDEREAKRRKLLQEMEHRLGDYGLEWVLNKSISYKDKD